MKGNNKKLLLLLLFDILFINKVLSKVDKNSIESPDQTCDKNDKINNNKNNNINNNNNNNGKYENSNDNLNDLKYSDYFLKQPVITKENINTSNYNSSEYFDLSVNKNILKYVKENGVIPYPHQRFKEKQQGNFLHFMHLAYAKNLPVYFTIDQMIYPYIEITKQLNFDINEFAFFPIYKSFLDDIIEYGIKTNFNKGIVLFFSLGLKFLNYDEINEIINKKIDNMDSFIFNEKLCTNIINEILSRDENDTNYIYNFTLLGSKRSFNKLNFVNVKKFIKKGNIISQKITNSLRFFQEFIFDASKELYNIYLIGKLIDESGQGKIYLKIKKFTQYLFNEEEENMNPLELYQYINNNYKNITKDEKQINELYEKIKEKIRKPKYFNFLEKIDFYNKEHEKLYYEEKNKEINLFSYSTNIENWVNDKMINYEKGRLFPSIVELIDIAYDGKIGRNTILKRFNAKEINDNLLIYRDGIDMMKELNESKTLIEQSLKKEKNKWINSYENSFNYLLNIIGHTSKENDRNSLIKSFNTILGSYIHFKKDIILIQQFSNISYAKDGNIPDIIFENNTKFYKEIKKVTEKYKENIIELVECLSNKDIKGRIIEIVDFKLNRLFKAYDNILNILNNKNKDNKNIIDEMFYYDRRSGQYQGWYVDLYKDNNFAVEYNLDIYAYNYYIANPIRQIQFQGAIIYEAMNYPEIGLISIDDKENKEKKLYLFSSYAGNEYPHDYLEKIDFKGLQELIVSRKY